MNARLRASLILTALPTLFATNLLATTGIGLATRIEPSSAEPSSNDFSGEVSGFFAAGDCRFEPSRVFGVHSIAPDGAPVTILLFSDRALEVDLSYAFDPSQAFREAMSVEGAVAPAGLIVTLENGFPNAFFWCWDATSGTTTQKSGGTTAADFELTENTASRLAGAWTLADDGDWSWDLRFDVAVIEPSALSDRLPRDGGEPGRRYLEFLEHLAAGDLEGLREISADPNDESWSDAGASRRLELMRELEPTSAEVTGGWEGASTAIVELTGTMIDGSVEERHVLLERRDDRWALSSLSALRSPAGASSEEEPSGADSPQSRTVAEIERSGTALYSWLTDFLDKGGEMPWKAGPLTADEIAAVLVPDYTATVPAVDGWGHAIVYTLLTDDPLRAADIFRIQSPGSDGVLSEAPSPSEAHRFPSGEPERDIVWQDGFFLAAPEDS
jgi:hypothetical protein